jgi:hypothetical protein
MPEGIIVSIGTEPATAWQSDDRLLVLAHGLALLDRWVLGIEKTSQLRRTAPTVRKQAWFRQ